MLASDKGRKHRLAWVERLPFRAEKFQYIVEVNSILFFHIDHPVPPFCRGDGTSHVRGSITETLDLNVVGIARLLLQV